jgi:hypothetical protein
MLWRYAYSFLSLDVADAAAKLSLIHVTALLQIGGRATARTTTYQALLPGYAKLSVETMASALYIMILIFVNLVGYSIGVAGVASVIDKIFYTSEGWFVIGVSFYFLCWGVSLMSFIEKLRRPGNQPEPKEM